MTNENEGIEKKRTRPSLVRSKNTMFQASFIELYNEQLFDLLSQKPRREDSIVDIREDKSKGIKIPELKTVKETMILLERASKG